MDDNEIDILKILEDAGLDYDEIEREVILAFSALAYVDMESREESDNTYGVRMPSKGCRIVIDVKKEQLQN